MKRILIWLSAVLLLSTIFLSNRLIVSERDRKIAESNVEVMLSDVETYKTKDSLNAASVRELQLRKSELIKRNSDYEKLIKQLKVDKKALESLVSAKVVVRDTVKMPVRDTIIKGDTLKAFNYKSHHLKLEGLVKADSVQIRYNYNNRITIIQNLVRKKFLFIKLPVGIFGYKHRKVDIVTEDKNASIECADFITIRK